MSASATASRAPASATQSAPLRSRDARRLFEPGRVTLEQRVLGIWEELRSAGHAECPLCGGELDADAGCAGCGAELS